MRAQNTDQLTLVDWLKEKGYSISKSALNRFSIKLCKADERLGLDRELMVKQNVDLAGLFEELAELKAREAQIIAEIKAATIFRKPSVSQ